MTRSHSAAGGPSKRSDLSFVCGIAFLVMLGILSCPVRADKDVVREKQVLTERLDSLELEKQMRKRKGLPLEDLEKASERLKDSIVAARRQLSSGEEGTQQAGDSAQAAKSADTQSASAAQDWRRLLPRNMFDWIVVAVGGVAIISGIILVVGLIGLASRGVRKKKKSVAPLHEKFPHTASVDLLRTNPKVPPAPAESEDDRVTSIRQRMDGSVERQPEDDDVRETEPGLTARPSQPRERKSADTPLSGDAGPDPAETRKLVVAASQQGLDVQEISRRFHLSADQVSLILRIARHTEGKGQ